MANYAALIAPLSISGSRLSDGTANASGKVWAFEPGTGTPAKVYSDAAATAVVTQPITLTNGGLLNRSSLPGGIFATQPIRLYIESSSGTVVSDAVYIPATAGNVGVSNAGFTDSTLDAVLTDAFTSFGGQDWTYKESSGATARTVKAKLVEQGISVKDFGAVGDGVADDTTAIQGALNRAKALSTNVRIPAGTYLVSQALTLTSGSGVRIIGSGSTNTLLKLSHATANLFTLTSSTGCGFESLTFQHTSSTTGAMIAAADCPRLRILDVFAFGSGFAYGVDHSGTTYSFIQDSFFTGSTRALRYNVTSTVPCIVIGGNISSAGTHIEFNGSVTAKLIGLAFSDVTGVGILFNAALTGADFTIIGCPGLASTTTALSIATATSPFIRQWGNKIDGYAASFATGTAQTPNWARGREIALIASSGGAGAVTVGAPTPTPGGGERDVTLTLRLGNAAGGAVTWTMNAIYVLVGGTAPAGVDGTTTVISFLWDSATSEWRERWRASTAT